MAFNPAIDTVNSLVTLDETKSFLSVEPELSLAEITDISCEADVDSSLNNKYFLINSPTVSYYVWFNVGDAGTDPALVSKTGIEVAIDVDEIANVVASKAALIIALEADFGATSALAVITITNAVVGEVIDVTNGNTTWSVAPDITTQGADITILEYLLNFYINAASSFCNTHTKRLLKSRALTEYYSGDNSDIVLLNNYPATVITKVCDDLARVYGVDTEIVLTNLVFMPDKLANQLIYDNGTFLKGVKNIKVEYTAGYVIIPWDLQQACLEIIAFFYYNTEEKRFGITSRTVGDGSLTVETTDIPKSSLRTLDTHKRKF